MYEASAKLRVQSLAENLNLQWDFNEVEGSACVMVVMLKCRGEGVYVVMLVRKRCWLIWLAKLV